MRLFCGLSLAYEVRRNIELLVEHLKPLAPLRWIPSDNLHITTKFIGEWPDDGINDLRARLAQIHRPPIPVSLRGIGWLPDSRRPQILYAGVEAEGLDDLAGETNVRLQEAGVPRETKAYRPHVTLARIKDRAADLAALRQAIEELPSSDFGRFVAQKHLLYRSRTTPTGSLYSVEAEFPFA